MSRPGRPGREAPPSSSGLVRHAEGLHVAADPPVPPAAPVPAPSAPPVISGLATAWEMVARAQTSVRTSPAQWGGFSLRIPGALKQRLEDRWLADRERLEDYELALGHYCEAALAEIPGDIDAAAAWGAAYAAAHRRERPVTVSPRLKLATANRMRKLNGRLQVRHDQRVRAWEVQAAAIERLLDRLDAEDGQPGS